MLNTAGDIITEVLVRNSRKTTDTFITDALMRSWLQDAHLWACAAHKWPFTEGRVSTTYTTSVTDDLGNTIVPYPEGWKADSIRILMIGGKRLDKLDFSSFLRFIENNAVISSNNTARVYSDYARQIYVNTGADVSGTLTVFGQYTPAIDPTDLTATTVFSGYDEEGNEAIVDIMSAYLAIKEDGLQLLRGKPVGRAFAFLQSADQHLEKIWGRIGDEQYNYQTKDQSMFNYINVIRGRGNYNNNADRTREDQW